MSCPTCGGKSVEVTVHGEQREVCFECGMFAVNCGCRRQHTLERYEEALT